MLNIHCRRHQKFAMIPSAELPSSSISNKHQTLRYTPCGRFWVRAASSSEKNTTSTVLEMGLTRALFDREIPGDIDSMSFNAISSSISLSWSGLKISDGDELYHTIWGNIEGVKEVDVRQLLPFVPEKCPIEMSTGRPPVYQSCEDQWLLRINMEGGDVVLQTAPTLLTEEQMAMMQW